MLKPNDSWMWYFDQQEDALMLDLGDEMVFRVATPKKFFTPEAYNTQTFTVDDADVYQCFKESITHLDISLPRKAELGLNAVAVARFHKPVMPKSWFFASSSVDYQPELGELITLQTEFGQAQFLVIETGDCASLCMQATIEPLTLNSSKEMTFCEVIKVMNDRIIPFSAEQEDYLALVG
ncbi:TPA: cell division protein ZapC [Photobacterium damselae]